MITYKYSKYVGKNRFKYNFMAILSSWKDLISYLQTTK